VVDHIPPKGHKTIRYYGLYSNRSRGSARPAHPIVVPPPRTRKPPPEKPQPAATQILLIPPREKTTARAMRPLWRDLIKAVWAVDPLQCPHCHSTHRPVETLTRPEAIEFFLRLPASGGGPRQRGQIQDLSQSSKIARVTNAVKVAASRS
jgi:hypothetical protein